MGRLDTIGDLKLELEFLYKESANIDPKKLYNRAKDVFNVCPTRTFLGFTLEKTAIALMAHAKYRRELSGPLPPGESWDIPPLV